MNQSLKDKCNELMEKKLNTQLNGLLITRDLRITKNECARRFRRKVSFVLLQLKHVNIIIE